MKFVGNNSHWRINICLLYTSSGVVPACASLDCVTVFANSLEDTETVNQYAKDYDTECVWSKEYEDKGKKLPEKIYLPLEEPTFFGDNADVHKDVYKRQA